MTRRKTRQVNCGNTIIGGTAPISIQSMTNTDTRDVKATVEQIERLGEAGCQIVRCAVPDMEAADAFEFIKKKSRLPLVADIHFDYRLAVAAIKAGADKVRINPGNIGDMDRLRIVAEAAKDRGIPIRIGVNSGSLEKKWLKKYGGPTAEAAAMSALSHIEFIEDIGFDKLVVSIKLTDLHDNLAAHRLLADKTDHPFHIGITEAGIGMSGIVKSAVGAGSLLLDGIGDTLRVSLTGDPEQEISAALAILRSLGLKEGAIQVISCPTCGRCKVALESIAGKVQEAAIKAEKTMNRTIENRTGGVNRNIIIAVMGCAVNGPGEAAAADIGVACGDGKGVIFRRGNILKTVEEQDIVEELMKGVESLWALN
jgi:(E)-4-hydroxy-3-methylbut-2-enyl-diphosphate synthase